MSRQAIARSAIALLAGGVVGLQFLGVGAATADDHDDCGYAADVITATDLTLDRTSIAPGETTTARVTVTSGAGVPPGTVTFQVTGHAASTVGLSAGAASYTIPSDLVAGTYTVTASYPGAPCYLPSSDSASLQVIAPAAPPPAPGPVAPPPAQPPAPQPPEPAPTEAVPPPEIPPAGGVAPRPAPTQGLLPSVGADSSVTWYGLAGLGLLGAGGISLLVHRRRRTSS